MSEIKTKPTKQSAKDFLNQVDGDQKRRDGFEILATMEKITGEKPVMWGTSIVGFGLYHYKSERSKQEGDWPLIGFSARKQNLTLYLPGFKDHKKLLEKLGKHKTGMGCLYINKLADVDQDALTKLIQASFNYMKETHG